MMSRHGVSGSLDGQLRFAISRRRLLELRYNDAVRVDGNGVEPVGECVDETLATGGQGVAKITDCVVLETPFKGSRGASHKQHHAWDTLYARVE